MYIDRLQAYFLPVCAGFNSSQDWDFFTEIQTSTDGDEERISLRELPHESLTYNYVYFRDKTPEVNRELSQNIRKRWIVPYWFFGIDFVNVTLDSNLNRSKVVLGNKYMIKTGSQMLVYKNEDDFFFTTALFTGKDESDRDYVLFDPNLSDFDFSEYRVYPCAFGRIVEDFNHNVNYEYYTFSVTYNIETLPEIEEKLPSRTFEGVDVYEECVSFEGDEIGILTIRDSIVSGNTLGVKVYSSQWDYYFKSFTMYVVTEGKDEFFDLLRWNARMLGQFRPIYMPTYLNDFDVVSITVDEVTVSYGREQEKVFAIFYDESGSFELHRAEIKSINGDLITYTFNEPLNEIPDRLCYASMYRLSSDSIGFDFSIGDGFVVSSIGLRSVV